MKPEYLYRNLLQILGCSVNCAFVEETPMRSARGDIWKAE
jgi:hypothetical protein